MSRFFDNLEPETDVVDHDYTKDELVERLKEIEYELIEANGKRYRKLQDEQAAIELELEEVYGISTDSLRYNLGD